MFLSACNPKVLKSQDKKSNNSQVEIAKPVHSLFGGRSCTADIAGLSCTFVLAVPQNRSVDCTSEPGARRACATPCPRHFFNSSFHHFVPSSRAQEKGFPVLSRGTLISRLLR